MKSVKKALYAWISKTFMDGCTSYNDLDVRKSCRSKEQARDAFAGHDIPHARGDIFINPLRAIRFAKEHGFPLVVKPNVGGFSRGSYFPIRNFKELWKAILLAKIWWPVSVVEQYLEGRNYRVLVANGKVISVIRRYPPQVTGNGQSSVLELIDQENKTREDMELYPCIYPLSKGETTKQFLAKSQRSLETVPAEGETVKLFHRIALAPGGVVETINKDTVPQENIQLMEKVLDIFNANILGIDVIMEKGIEYSFEDQKCILLEVNSRPYVKMHDYPRYGEKEDLTRHFEKLDNIDIQLADVF
ncbi:cyanophycin synthetase [Sansalvadorimonas sp. 2012CJ34-2]|uniref:Cyanophycin synthetase n=1 Tax=Parendozoicomonas callyspongiae TaxID=2942213 RepID=A0ABT0PIK1_9GAMM|nr:cyanophycin synthetase [Sansalvadorimonas sp. 2012CJ34-2]MCL6270313.1 cyanophycin synthetase [Sansalvadorimonas sp. 2012CJ34-2]